MEEQGPPAQRPPLIVILGPTATGKTELGVALAQEFDGEIVSADSRQVYRGMDVGTAKPAPEQRVAAPHHLVDVVDPDEAFNAARFQRDAREVIAAIHARGRLPLLVGGTGLYIRAICANFDFPGGAPAPAVRARLEERLAWEGLGALAEELRLRAPAVAAATDLRNPRRVLRALERLAGGTGGRSPHPDPLAEEGGAGQERQGGAGMGRGLRYRLLKIGLTGPREVLRDRVARRAEAMFAQGFVEEVRRLLAAGYSLELPALTGQGYREVGRYLRGEITLEEALVQTVRATQQYLRRQETWFRREPDVTWLDITQRPLERARALVRGWL